MLLFYLLSIFTLSAVSLDIDENGYILYCPCMGRFGNQADHFLGAFAFSKALNRTLVLPPWVEYRWPNPKSGQIPFDTYFKVEPLKQYHRVILMEEFMKKFASTIWPPSERRVFCYSARPNGKKENDCNAKDGNPFEPFWDTFSIDFIGSEFYGPLYFDLSQKEIQRWKEKYPADKHLIMAFTGAPAPFPVKKENVALQKYLKWSNKINKQAEQFIKKEIEKPFIGIHLRNGVDFRRACDHVSSSAQLFASPQCLGYRNEHGKLTDELCYPSDDIVVNQVKRMVKKYDAKTVFIATDDRDLIKEMSKSMKKVKFVKLKESDPHVDLCILAKSDYYIGNCVSSFSAFAKRERDAVGLPSGFWAFRPKARHDEF